MSAIVDAIVSVVDAVVDVVQAVVEVVIDIVEVVWDEIVMPVLELTFALIGIDSETVVDAQRVSVAVFSTNTDDAVQAAITRAVIRKLKTETDFFPNYMQEIYQVKGQVKSYYNYANNGTYVHGLPTMTVSGARLDNAAQSTITNAIYSDTGITATTIKVISGYLEPLRHFQGVLQDSHQYAPYNNTLTKTDIYGVSRSDWTLLTPIVYNIGTVNYTINIQRTAELTKFWIEGPGSVTESNDAVFTVKANRTVPVGQSITINLTYSGTALDGVNYTEVSSVVMPELTSEVDVTITTIDIPIGQPSTSFTITLDSVPNTGGVFEHVIIDSPGSVTCTIASDDALVLTMNDIAVPESGNATIPVKLEQAALGAFTVDYTFTDIDTVGGVDYNNTTGTLSFLGTANEVQNIIIPITGDLVDDDKEKFQVGLTNCSDATVDITRFATVTIQDDTDIRAQTMYMLSDTITGADYVPERNLIATYHATSAPQSEWFYWLYRYADGTYPNIDSSSYTLSNLEMLPVAVLRKDSVFCDVDKSLPLYITTKALMDRLSLDIDDFIANIANRPDSQLASITDAYVNFSMVPSNTHEVVSKLLYLSFYELIVTKGLNSEVNEYSALFTEGDINNSVVWTDHTYTTGISGTVTSEDKYIHTITPTTDGSTLYLRHQDTPTTYKQLTVLNLNAITSISYNGYHQVAINTLWNTDNSAVNTNFSMAISWFVFSSLTAREQVAVYKHICRLDLYSLTVTELEFYETQAFADFFEFVSIVLTIVTLGTSGIFTASLTEIIKTLVIHYAIGELVVFVAEATGSAVLAAVVGVIASGMTGSGEFKLSDLIDPENFTETATYFAHHMSTGFAATSEQTMQEWMDKGMKMEDAQEKLDKKIADAKIDSPITADFLNSLKSLEAQIVSAIDSQYQFEETFGYGKVGNYHNTQLIAEIV